MKRAFDFKGDGGAVLAPQCSPIFFLISQFLKSNGVYVLLWYQLMMELNEQNLYLC
jgi:hypothetical protein